MKFDTEYIEKLADLLNAKGLSELTLEDGNQAISIKREFGAPVQPVITQTEVVVPTKSESEEAKRGKAITSPMVGTFYRSPAPDADRFVEVGQTVSQGQVVCIVEAMKLMNEIESEFSGKIVEICVEDGQPVEFGQVLMYVE